ncbi:T9SS type A sorting domain-containing protein [Hymenobacter sp. UV11]|uniref:T9SS type A sorting domain-containing protein n=1 Tax=Hymenobacter sp. UV11 TaxID=1849735 RepID=UPI00106153FA|nr:T9SS type A sorting domain-containing protein [Hymenobacter sp. UV11]TDN36321.1 hypothetical protein A8B98_10460 [Hymenobacter sp. UV11]TFZ67032.1 T9SS type A sorting domain-containing protein [Hymenobacter sp. UV11]
MKPLVILASALLLAPLGLLAQKAPAAKPKPAAAKPAAAKPAAKPAAMVAKAATPGATADAAEASSAPIALAPVTPAPDPNALKIKAEQNPIAHTLTVRCDAPGPTRFEINDNEGRPVLTKNVMVGTSPVVLSVSSLPAGSYVVRCTAGEKKGMRLVQLSN